jgi:uncharacterized membrane protein YgdD (TMEM256/DUF423 family)
VFSSELGLHLCLKYQEYISQLKMKNNLITLSVLGTLAVALGAFCAHALKPHLTEYQLSIFHTASQYHFYFTGFYFLVILTESIIKQEFTWTKRCFLGGIILFSGSLYLLATTSLHSIPSTILGPITPLGGLLFIIGFVLIPFQFKR